MYLHRRGLGAQQDAAVVLEIEGVRPFAGGVAFVDVELGEVVFRLLDFGAVENFKAHADEDVLDLVEDVVHRVLVPQRTGLARQRDVNGLTLKLQLHELGAKLGLALLDGGLNVAAQLVCQLTHDGALLGGKLAHLAKDAGELALLAQILDAQALQKLDVVGFENGLDGTVSKSLH